MEDWSGGLRVSGGHIKLEKGYWYPIQWGLIDGNSSMLSYDYAGNIYITKRYGEQVAIKKLNIHQYKKLMGVCQNPLGNMTKQTIDLKNKIQ